MNTRTSNLRILSLLSLFLFSLATVVAQNVKIELKAPESVEVDGSFRFQYIVESEREIDEVLDLDVKDGFEVLAGPYISQSISTTTQGGERTVKYNTSFSYLMRATRAGNHTFPKAKITLYGKTYKSTAAKIAVKGDADAKKKTKKKEIKAFVRTLASKKSVNVSDTLTLTYRLYSTEQPSQLLDVKFPSTRDFQVANMRQAQQTFREETIDKTKYWVIDLRVQILQPREVGMKSIPEGQVEIEFATPTGRKLKNMWGEVYEEMERERKTLLIESIDIQVQNLIAI